MPIYEYRCGKCGNTLELITRVKPKIKRVCHKCWAKMDITPALSAKTPSKWTV